MRTVRSYPSIMAGVTLAFVLSVSTASAHAASTFLLQFGQHENQDAARAQWDGLQREYPQLLGNLDVHVAEVETLEGAQAYRTQAGGVASRQQAQSICGELTAADVPCLVVETSMYMPETQAAEDVSIEMMPESAPSAALEPAPELAANNVAVEMPAQTASVPQAAPQEKSFRESVMPWLGFGGKKEAQPQENAAAANAERPRPERITRGNTQPINVQPPMAQQPLSRSEAVTLSQSLESAQKLAPGETRVVASRAPRNLAEASPEPQQLRNPSPQAVPVSTAPLSGASSGEAQVEVAEAIQVPLTFGERAPVPVDKPVGYGGFPSQPQVKRGLWVQLNHFNSREAAMAYWRELTNQNPELMRLLRVRIITGWNGSAATSRRAAVRLGPFADRAEIDALCRSAAQRGLKCSFVKEVGSAAAADNTPRRPYPLASQGLNRREATTRSYSRTPGSAPMGMFWVQLGAFDNVGDAQARWGALQSSHNDMLGRMQPQISYPALSSSPTPVYHLRTGPFVNKAGAISLCDSLRAHNLGCIVVQAR